MADLAIPATFLFSLGPDHTGRAIKRIFRPGFFKKVSRSSVVSLYGFRTLLNGTLLPAPHIGRRNAAVMYQAYTAGHEVGIHCYDHIRWQDGLAHMSALDVTKELAKARTEFNRIFGFPAKTAGAAGWQANAFSLNAYDSADFLYGSDTRGNSPFFPCVNHHVFKTLQIPTTLPTLDELLGRPEYPLDQLTDFYLRRLQEKIFNVWTIHAEIEGMKYLSWFKEVLIKACALKMNFIKLEQIAQKLLYKPEQIPLCELLQGQVDGRSGQLAIQGPKRKLR